MNSDEMLNLLLGRRSIRQFTRQPIDREIIERLFVAGTSAPSNTNRQPWRFAAVTSAEKRAAIVAAVKERADEMKAIIRQGHHAQDFGNYSDFFHEPLEAAALIVIPQYRPYPDLIANFIASGGGDPEKYDTAAAMQAELCSTSAAVMGLLVQAHAEGLGGCWMAGPMIARDKICEILGIKEPWRMIGAVALGYPEGKEAVKPRKALTDVVQWF